MIVALYNASSAILAVCKTFEILCKYERIVFNEEMMKVPK